MGMHSSGHFFSLKIFFFSVLITQEFLASLLDFVGEFSHARHDYTRVVGLLASSWPLDGYSSRVSTSVQYTLHPLCGS